MEGVYGRAVDVSSLGYQTDLALLRLGGSEIADRGDHLVVRTPHNPTFWWGNFLLLAAPPPVEDTSRWLDTFAQAFPDAAHVALGFDGVAGSVADLTGFATEGMQVEGSTVMTAQSVHVALHSDSEATYRLLSTEDDWAQHVDLRVACHDGRGMDDYRAVAAAKATTMRALVHAGHGGWFGAFQNGELLSSLGLFRIGTDLARFQSVETHPAARGRGLAGTLVYVASTYGFTELRVRTLVMVADPEYSAIRLYRSVGFTDAETQLQAERPPARTSG